MPIRQTSDLEPSIDRPAQAAAASTAAANAPPEVSVVMPVYNAERFLGAAVDSIRAQTFTSFELIAVDDGSTDSSRVILEQYRMKDSRIVLLEQKHRGIVAALNAGIARARGAFIARMDADDISLPRRIAAQVAFLREHDDVAACGCQLRSIADGPRYTHRYETRHDDIICNLPFISPMPHAATVFRKRIIPDHGEFYRDIYPNSEDYDLWIRLARSVRFANLPSVLYLYRQHPAQVTKSRPDKQRELRRMLLAELGLDPTSDEAELHEAVSLWSFPRDPETLGRIHGWLLCLAEANKRTGKYPPSAFECVLARRWGTILHYFTRHGMGILRPYRDSILNSRCMRFDLEGIKLRLKYLMRYDAQRRNPSYNE
jgi:glycosyltransferase involved in cell wall biosynthesis